MELLQCFTKFVVRYKDMESYRNHRHEFTLDRYTVFKVKPSEVEGDTSVEVTYHLNEVYKDGLPL